MDISAYVCNEDFGVGFQTLWGDKRYCLSVCSGGNTLEISMTADQAAAVANAIAAELNKHIEGAG